jgi:hypothetical protein
MQGYELFRQRQGGVAAVNGATGRGKDKPLGSGKLGVLQKFHGPQAIDQEVRFGMIDGILIGK